MIKILTHGNSHRVAECPSCGCRFEYTGADVKKILIEDWLKCPDCGYFEAERKFEE